ncbi:MAG TPA: WXG100 family type VII secretion target [Nocardioides sp.]|uniref:WXG100 family type VII secretion target n=1 Tax=Nocardioides sp. TaxID=35761 RepID=UPI002E339D6A|nr:WXG100 family type VII secretion target [Nocardioides sp.]HEX5089815.1 WXG100 family type VII secretion target [Nocardioides sp.]
MSMHYADLARAISDVRETADDLDRGRTKLHTSFGSFLGGGWRGEAAESFVGGWDDWSDGVGTVLGALHSIADLLEAHGRDLRVQDGGAESSLSTLHSRLGGSGGGH